MKVTINNREITLRYSFRALMLYEKIVGTSFNPKGLTEIMIYFYSTILASDKDINLTFEEFMNWVDENPTVFNDFSKWLTSTLTRNSIFNESDGSGEDSTLKKN